jgi:carbonic anhydrase
VPQRPFAIILGCSDSRLPVELIFDQGFGDLFVVRVAGNIVAPSLVGSIEFAATEFGSNLVVVLGHTGCGAITATLKSLATGRGPVSTNMRSIVEMIAPHIEGIEDTRRAVRANVAASVRQIRDTPHLPKGVVVVGAEYELETGEVRVFDRGGLV